MQACVDDVEYALRLMQKAAVARQARVSVQTPEGLRSFLRAGGDDSQSSGTVSEARRKEWRERWRCFYHFIVIFFFFSSAVLFRRLAVCWLDAC